MAKNVFFLQVVEFLENDNIDIHTFIDIFNELLGECGICFYLIATSKNKILKYKYLNNNK